MMPMSVTSMPIAKPISIIPRGRAALGYTIQLPAGEQFLLSRSEMRDKIRGVLGGRMMGWPPG